MDKVRLLTRMDRPISNRSTSNSPVDHAKWPLSTVPFIPSDNRSCSPSHWSSTNLWRTNDSRNTLRPYTHKGARKADVGAAGKSFRSTVGRYQKETGRVKQVRWKRCLGDVDGLVEAGVEAGSAGASAILTLSADGFLGCRGGGGLTQLMGFHTMEFLGAQHTWDTGIACTLGPTDIHYMNRIGKYPIRRFP